MVNKILDLRGASVAILWFYCVIDTVYVEYTGLFCVSLLCPCVFHASTLLNESHAGIWLLIIYVEDNAWEQDGNTIFLCLLVTDWLADGMTDYITDWMTDWMSNLEYQQLQYWLIVHMTEWLTTVQLDIWPADRMTDRATDWMTD